MRSASACGHTHARTLQTLYSYAKATPAYNSKSNSTLLLHRDIFIFSAVSSPSLSNSQIKKNGIHNADNTYPYNVGAQTSDNAPEDDLSGSFVAAHVDRHGSHSCCVATGLTAHSVTPEFCNDQSLAPILMLVHAQRHKHIQLHAERR